MNPVKYAQMMKYLTRAKKANPELPNVFPASQAPIPAKTQNVKEIESINRFVRSNPRQDMAGGGMLVQPGFGGTRQGYATSSVKTKKFKYPVSNQFGTFYSDEKPKDPNKQKIIVRDEKTKFINKLVSDANAGDKYVSIGEIGEKVKKKFKLKNAKSINVTSFPSLELLESRADKIDKVLRDMLISDKPLNGFWHNVISERTGVPINQPGNLRILEQSPTYNSIKDQGLDLLKVNYSRKSFNYLHDFSLSDQLSKALEIAKGNPTYVGLGGEKLRTALPSNKIMEFALRSWNTNKGSKDGPIQFFDKNGKRIIWKKGIKLPYKNVSFSFDGKMHKKSDLNTDYMKKFFPEVYNNQIAINNLSVTKIDNPFKPGSKISVKDLIKKIQVDSYGWSPRFPTLEILHGKKGVAAEPFSNLTYATRDLNQLENSVNASLRAGNIKPAEANRLIKTIRSTISGKTGDDLREAIITRQLNLAKQKDLTFPRMKEIGMDEFKKLVATLSKDPRCTRGFKSQGGRAGFQDGNPPSLDVCYQGGVKNINSGMKNVTPAQAKNFAAFANRAASLGRGIMKYGIVPEALYVAADSLIRAGMGDNFNEAFLRATEYLRPGDQTKLAETLEADRFFGPEVAGIINKSLSYKNELAKVQSLEDQKANLENLSGGDEFDYIGDLSQDVKNIDAQIKQATDNLNNKFKITDAERIYAERMQDEVDDARSAGSFFTKLKSKFRDVEPDSDIETLGVPEKTQEQLNQRMLPQASTIYKIENGKLIEKNLSEATQTEIMDYVRLLKPYGYDVSTKNLLEQRNYLRGMPLSEQEQLFGKEATYGASGTMGEPIKKPVFKKPQNVIGDMEKEIVGQTNVANPFDIDISDIGTGLRGFSAAGGGIAKEAGDPSGPPPESGPNSQGLPGLLKRVRNL